jgi:hypothetical protein
VGGARFGRPTGCSAFTAALRERERAPRTLGEHETDESVSHGTFRQARHADAVGSPSPSFAFGHNSHGASARGVCLLGALWCAAWAPKALTIGTLGAHARRQRHETDEIHPHGGFRQSRDAHAAGSPSPSPASNQREAPEQTNALSTQTPQSKQPLLPTRRTPTRTRCAGVARGCPPGQSCPWAPRWETLRLP